jgi:hypothetical protein
MQNVVLASLRALSLTLKDLSAVGGPGHGFEELFGESLSRSPFDFWYPINEITNGRARQLTADVTISPKIACMDPTIAALYDHPTYLSHVCTGEQEYEAAADAIYILPTAYIAICPSFFKRPEKPPLATRQSRENVCPLWNGTNNVDVQKGPREEETMGYQPFILIRELVRFYDHEMRPRKHEMTTWKEMLSSSPADSLKNPTSYQAYVASEFYPHRICL